jgi:hypothetical protein
MMRAARVLTAGLGVIVSVALVTYIAVHVHTRSGWNLLWMFGLPTVATFIFYRRSALWPAAWVGLTICAFCTVALTAQVLGSAP